MTGRPIDFYLLALGSGLCLMGLWLSNLKRAATISSMQKRWGWALLLMGGGAALILYSFFLDIPKVN